MQSDTPHISVVCLCGTYLKAREEAMGKITACPSCHGAIEIRSSTTADGQFALLFLKATRIAGKGKARWKWSDGFEGFVEQIALKAFEERGWQGVWGENSLWEFMMALLFWDVFFAPIEGMWEPLFAQGSTLWEQDMPRDWGGPEFYERRRSLIAQRLECLRSVDLHEEINNLYFTNCGRRCRPIWNWNKFSAAQLASAATALPRADC